MTLVCILEILLHIFPSFPFIPYFLNVDYYCYLSSRHLLCGD